MAISIDASSLSKIDKERIWSDLTITPRGKEIPEYIASRMSSRALHVMTAPPGPPFKFLVFDEVTKELRLPYHYARTELDIDHAYEGHRAIACTKILIGPRSHQISIFESTREHLRRYGTTTILVQPGAGKTYMSLCLALELGLRTCVITPIKTLNEQWRMTYEMITGTTDRTYIVQEPAKERKIRKKLEKDEKGSKKTAFKNTSKVIKNKKSKNTKTSKKVVKQENRKNPDLMISLTTRVPVITERLRDSIGTLIIDEAHLMCTASRVPSILQFLPRYVIVLTATLDRDDSNHAVMHHLSGTHNVFKEPYRPHQVMVVKTNITATEVISRSTDLPDFDAFKKSLAASDEYNDIIADIVARNPHRKFIILTSLVSHSRTILAKLKARDVDCDIMTGNKEDYHDCQALVATALKVGTGFDAATKALNFDGINPDTLIFAEPVKKKSKFIQCVGRIMRANEGITPVVIWLDTNNRIPKNQFKSLESVMTNSGATIVKAVIRDPSAKGDLNAQYVHDMYPCGVDLIDDWNGEYEDASDDDVEYL